MKKNGKLSRPAPVSSSRVAALVENHTYFLGLADVKGRITYINTAGRKMCGISPRGRLDSIHLVDLFTSSFRHQFEQAILPSILNTGRWQGSTYLVHSKRRPRLHVEITLISLGTNRSKKITSIAITIRKKPKRASVDMTIRQSEEQLKKLFNDAVLGMYQTTPAGRILMANKALVRMLGYRSADELKKRNLERDGFEPTYDRTQFKKDLEKHDVLTGLESSWEKADGTFIHVRENSRVVRDDAGKVLYYEGTVEDVTERNKAEQALKLSEEKYRSIVETTTEWIWEMDTHGIHTYSNQRVEEILGYPVEEFLRRGAFEFMEPEDQANVRQKLPGLIESKQGWRDWIIRWKHRDGSIRYLESNASPIFDTQENITGYRGVDRDITERKRVEEALRSSEELFRATFENANVGVSIVGLDERLLKVNEEMCRIFGYCREELEKMTVNSIAYPDDTNISPAFIKKALSEDTQHDSFNKRYIHKDGHQIWGHVSSSLIKDTKGRPLYFISHVQDITDHMRAEETLRESEERFRTIFEEGQFGVTIAGPDFRFIITNPAFCRMIGYTATELAHMTFADITPKNHIDTDVKNIMDLRDGKIIQYRTEKQYMKKDGSLFWGNLICSTIRDTNGKVTRYLAMIEDITDRKRAEEALRQSEERLRRAQVIASIGNWELDLVTETFWGSDEIYRICGVEDNTDFESSKSFRSNVLPEYENRLKKLLSNLGPEKNDLNFEFQIQRVNDGQIRYIHAKAEVEFDPDGRPIKANGVSQDITEFKKIEEARRLSEKQFFTLADQSPNMIFINVRGKVVYVNKACEEIVGYTSEEFCSPNFNFMTLIAPESRSIVQNAFQRHSKGEDHPSYEYILITKDGTRKNVINSVRLIDHEGEKAILGVVTDITVQKTAEEALRESEERYRRLVEFSPEPVIVHSMGKIVYANPAALTLVGAKTAAQILGTSVVELVHPEYRDFVRQRISSGLTEGKTLPVVEEKFLKLDGSPIDVEVAALPIVYEGKPAMQVVIRDVTEQKKLQSQLLQAQKLEAIGRLAGGVAHDYNNMIGVILGYASLLEKQIPRTDPSFLKVQSIITAANRTAELTRQLLAFARKQIATPRLLNLNDELIPLQKMIGRLIGEDITLKIRPQQDLWTIRIDPTQIAQVLTNLATNARDAIKDTGTISIETSNITIEQRTPAFEGDIPPGEYVVLIFSDTGTGMDNMVKQQIFEPFFTTKSKEEGTGLGLSTVFGIVKQNNGFITLQSELGHGTTFTIFFPRFFGEPEIPARVHEEASLSGTETILVVEDEEELLNFVTTALEQYGYTILGAKSPGAAFDIARGAGRSIELLITDVVMPDMNGKEFQNQLVSLYPHIQAIFMSGYSADIVAHRGILEEGVNFLQKPFTQKSLAVKVREVLDKR
jgi:two-component system, cell cycle sensor histidine kinase and response regulator CckA